MQTLEKADAIDRKSWPLIVDGSKNKASMKAAMKLFVPDQRYNGAVVFKVRQDDVPLITKQVRVSVESCVNDFIGRQTEVHFSIVTEIPPEPAIVSDKSEDAPDQSAVAFRKKLGWLIKESPDAVKMTITPEMAAVMLERNSSDEWKNRPESGAGVKRYAKRIAEGGWVYTGQTLIFSDTGNLLNGQHTLSAVVDANKPIDALVAFGVSDEAFKFMDTGIHRKASHIFAIEGIKNYTFASSVARLVYGYINKLGNPKGMKVDNDVLLDFYYKHQSIQDSAHVGGLAAKYGLLTPAWSGFLHYICAQKNRAMADVFFETVLTGVGVHSTKCPEHVLRSRLIKNLQSKSDNTDAPIYTGAYVIKAWNAKRKGGTIGVLKWRPSSNPNEPFPRAI